FLYLALKTYNLGLSFVTDSQKTAVIFGLANKRSIAWAIAQKLQEFGGRLGLHVRSFLRRPNRAALRRTEIPLRHAPRHRSQRRLCPRGRIERRIPKHHP